MKRGRIIYIGILLIAVFLVSTVFFSYAFLTSINEEHGKLNIVVGTLDYKITSNDLKNNKITVKANEIKEIDIKLTSLNDIDSKYEMFYTLDKTNNNVRVGYSKDTIDGISGTIKANSTNNINIVIRNESNADSTITFDVIGGLKNNELVLKEGNSLNQVVGIYTVYNIGDEITLIDGSKWHVLEASDDTEENIVLLSDYNLNNDGSYNDSCQGILGNDESYRCNPIAFDPDNTNVYNENDANNIGYFMKNTYIPKITKSLNDNSIVVSLPVYIDIKNASNLVWVPSEGYDMIDGAAWLLTTNYWLNTQNGSNGLSAVIGEDRYRGLVGHNANGDIFFGIRPKVVLSKKHILSTMSSDTVLSIGTSVEAIDGSKWHVLEASSSDSKYVTLLSDYNLNSDGTYNTECQGIDGDTESYKCSPMSFDSDATDTYDVTDINNIGYFIKNTYAPVVILSLPETTNVTLPTAEQIAIADNQIFNQTNLSISSDWLLTTGYWTKTKYESSNNRVWFVYGVDSVLNLSNSLVYSSVTGARPVITTLKTNLLAQ